MQRNGLWMQTLQIVLNFNQRIFCGQHKRLKLRKNSWHCETYQFDEVLTEFASQKRVYEVVAKPVVESVLEGYNGTVMAYGQTGAGKTFTLGRLGEEDTADRGIMVRAMEDILADLSSEYDSVSVSYLQSFWGQVGALQHEVEVETTFFKGFIALLLTLVIFFLNHAQRDFVEVVKAWALPP
eukprot:Gb_23028 [translate_table: standard]